MRGIDGHLERVVGKISKVPIMYILPWHTWGRFDGILCQWPTVAPSAVVE